MKTKFLVFFLICPFVFSLFMLPLANVRASSLPVVSIDPKVNGAAPSEIFSVKVTVSNVSELYAWQFNLLFNSSVLEALNVVEGPFLQQYGSTMMTNANINNTGGYVFAGCAFMDWGEHGANGSGVLATVSFRVLSAGFSSLVFSAEDMPLRTYDGSLPVPMACETEGGVFGYPRDLAVVSLASSSSSVSPGESVTLTAGVRNMGVLDEIANVTFYLNSTAIGSKSDVTVNSGANGSAVFTWDTSSFAAGSYTLKAQVGTVPGENDADNNVFSDGVLTIELSHDVAITNVVVSHVSITSGGTVSINVTVLNKGSGTESFSVTVTCGDKTVGTKEVNALTPGESRVVTLVWETKDVAAGDYTLTATIAAVAGETATADNVFSDVNLKITSAGFVLPFELLIAIVVVAIVVVAVVMSLFMRRRSKKP